MSRPNATSIEQKMREQLSEALGNRPYRMWFTNTKVQCNEEGVNILAATPLAASWITKRFSAVIEDAAKITFGKEMTVSISVDKDVQPETENPVVSQPQQRQKVRKQHKRQLLSFDDFVVGTCNELACAAAKQITHENGKSISPLFIHGSCGVGKTHLLQAICKHTAKHSHSKVRYVTAEQFTNEFIASSRCGEFVRFRNRYRNLDVLAIDDIHFVASKIKTQEELLHTIDAADLRGARLILASDEDPRHLRKLNKALTNRFVAGLIAEIKRPDRETRRNIIKQLMRKQCIELTDCAVERLASQAVGSIREIEGTVTRIRATASLFMSERGAIIGSDIVERVLRATPANTLPIRIADVVEATCKRAGLSVQEVRGSSRSSNIVFWRSVASYLGRKLTSLSYPELAAAIGRKNHSTVHAAVKRIALQLEHENTSISIGNDTIELREVIDQLTWAVRTNSNGTTKQKPLSERNRRAE
jgi:chromosomal replication initiator protein